MIFSPLEQFNVAPVLVLGTRYDFSFNNILLPLLIIIFISLILTALLKHKAHLIPSYTIQYIIENLTEFIFSIIKQQIGKEGYVFFPLIFTVFNFILLSNYISLLPMGIALTSHIIVTLFLSTSLCVSIFVFVWCTGV